MKFEDKKIYFILSPHINYYHSYRGDSRGSDGFGKDLQMMRAIIEKLDEIEDKGLCNGNIPITWDYGDTYWSIQLQQEYQPEILDRVVERCKEGKDEVLIGSWGNVAQSILDTEEFRQQHEWFLENRMGIGVSQLFKGRVAPYARTQETMFTQGMIEQYNELGVEGLCLYYSLYPFDVGRPFINPRLNWNERYGLLRLRSQLTDASILMIPMYAFGDIIDFFSIKRWFKIIRKHQKMGHIEGHALLFFNFDMDYENWIGVNLPRFLRWMPNTRGLDEFAEIVDQNDFIEFTSLLDIIPKLKVQGERILTEDVADGNWNGYYNWAQKYSNTKFWTIGQQARWLKCTSDTLKSIYQEIEDNKEIELLLRNENDLKNSYIKNKLLFASTTNFGMSMPFQHPHRRKTALKYGIKALSSSGKALVKSFSSIEEKLINSTENDVFDLYIFPITRRGISSRENIPLESDILVKLELPEEIKKRLNKGNQLKMSTNKDGTFTHFEYISYSRIDNKNSYLELILRSEEFNSQNFIHRRISIGKNETKENLPTEDFLKASQYLLKNQYIEIDLNKNGKIMSLKFEGEEFGCPNFLTSSVKFGKISDNDLKDSQKDNVEVLRDGTGGHSASLRIISIIPVLDDKKVHVEKVLTLYNDIDKLFVKIKMKLCDIVGEKCAEDGTSYVKDTFDDRWQEIMPCEVRPKIHGSENPLRIWKKNFMGYISYFDLDMREIDKKNCDIDCLVSNISDGWMALTNRQKGILVGFNSLVAANFAFSPIKLRDKGFGDSEKQQQIRINPFGTYYGKFLHYWTEASGHAQKILVNLLGTDHSTASTFSGRSIDFELILAPYFGDKPPQDVRNCADHFSLPPLTIFGNKNTGLYENYSKYINKAKNLIKENEIEELIEMPYLEWVKRINKDFDESKISKAKGMDLNIGIGNMLRLLIDGIRGKF